nr:MAG TPA: hypothetical protein [Caudoviricetes sp.]DAX13288.1 MAG TPA: hypothetical protein [Bacteriophage sp.]
MKKTAKIFLVSAWVLFMANKNATTSVILLIAGMNGLIQAIKMTRKEFKNAKR